VQGYAELFLGEAAISGAGAALAVPPAVPPRVVLCSPHPDDEALTGLLPLRLKEENDAQVVNLAMTLGSNPARRAERRAELLRACGVLGFGVRVAREPEGFPAVSALARGREPARWQSQVADLTALFADLRPELLLFPHAADSHPTHIGTHFLALAAALGYSRATGASFLVAETEYWHPNPAPNLLVGATVEQVALLLTALAEHRGEMARYPYHRAMPPRMLDTVRRCSELVQGYGSVPPPLVFGEAYALSAIRQGVWQRGSGALMVVPTEALTMERLASAFAMPRC
jgi:LmbE family N-acetylglucosaminyl deacetylase